MARHVVDRPAPRVVVVPVVPRLHAAFAVTHTRHGCRERYCRAQRHTMRYWRSSIQLRLPSSAAYRYALTTGMIQPRAAPPSRQAACATEERLTGHVDIPPPSEQGVTMSCRLLVKYNEGNGCIGMLLLGAAHVTT